jgi:hypothetical protein
MKLRRLVVCTIIVLLVIYLGSKIFAGYSFSKESAIQHSFPNQKGKIVFEKDFDNKKVIILETEHGLFVKQVDIKLGIFYMVRNVGDINIYDNQEALNTTWTAQLVDDQYYDTLFAVKVSDPTIKKVIVSNEGSDLSLSNLEEVKKQSTFYVEMEIINGFGAHYLALSPSEAGNFVFRGLNENEEIVSVK